MRVAVTGGTGFIGKHLVSSLVGRGYAVRCLVRKTSRPADLEFLRKLGVELREGDVRDIGSLHGLCDDADVVFHLAGVLGGFKVPAEQYFQLHVRGTKNLLELCESQKFIYCSSAGVLGPVVNGNEQSGYNPTNKYEESKAEAEKIVKKYSDYVIIRPEFVYGPHDMHVLRLFRAIKNNRFRLIGKGNSYLHPTYVGDVVQALLNCVKHRNQTFVVAGERAVTVHEFVLLVCKTLGIPFAAKNIPIWLAKLSVPFLESAARTFGFRPRITRPRLKFFTLSRTFDTTKAKKKLNYKPVKLEVGLRKTLDWYKKHGYL